MVRRDERARSRFSFGLDEVGAQNIMPGLPESIPSARSISASVGELAAQFVDEPGLGLAVDGGESYTGIEGQCSAAGFLLNTGDPD